MNLKDKIIQHYDAISPFYRDLWGVHIHHGYWITGAETKEKAQEQLIDQLISRAKIHRGARILDVGCGLGGTAIYLNRNLGAHVTGITISPMQIEIGKQLANRCGTDVRLLLMDAETLEMDDQFDFAWSVEAISHLSRKRDCFLAMARLLKSGGKLVIADWFKSDTATEEQEREFLKPIERAMLVPRLETSQTYARNIDEAGLDVISFEDLSANVSKTWDVAIALALRPMLWKFAATLGNDFLSFLEGFAAMKAAYKSKSLIYGVLVAHKQ